MKHAGKATRAALKLIYWTLFFLVMLMLAAMLAKFLGEFLVPITGGLFGVWVLFLIACLFFFRDPDARVPQAPEAVVAPGSGKVDVVDEVEEPTFVGGRCRRVSIFLSVFDVHVQRAPVAGEVVVCQHTPGQFLNAMRQDSAALNENVLIGFASRERPGEKIGVRLIAGLIARRIVPWVKPGDVVARGERISLIQFGSRCDVYLPLSVQVKVKPGDRARGGETILATRP